MGAGEDVPGAALSTLAEFSSKRWQADAYRLELKTAQLAEKAAAALREIRAANVQAGEKHATKQTGKLITVLGCTEDEAAWIVARYDAERRRFRNAINRAEVDTSAMEHAGRAAQKQARSLAQSLTSEQE